MEYLPSLNLVIIKSVIILTTPIIYFISRKKTLKIISLVINAYFIFLLFQNFNAMTMESMPKEIWKKILYENIFSTVLILTSIVLLFLKRRPKELKEDLVDNFK